MGHRREPTVSAVWNGPREPSEARRFPSFIGAVSLGTGGSIFHTDDERAAGVSGVTGDRPRVSSTHQHLPEIAPAGRLRDDTENQLVEATTAMET